MIDGKAETERLIEMLSANIEPVNRHELRTSLAAAVVIGGVAAFCLMLNTVSLRDDLGASGSSVMFLSLKLAFAVTVIAAGVAFLNKAMRPGQEARTPLRWAFVPFVAIGIAAAAELAFGFSTTRHPMTAGTHWVMCLYCIPLFAAIPFALIVWALRRGAPTNLTRTGAMAGLVAGAIGTAAYAFHCPDDSLPFIALWYGASIAVCAAIGAFLGPRVLRW